MSRSTCSNSNPRVSTRPEASAQNMKASSASGLCPRRIRMRRSTLAANDRAGRTKESLHLVEEAALEFREDLLACEGRDLDVEPLLLEDSHLVLERFVGVLERALELVACEDEVLGARFAGGAVLGIDRAADGPRAVLAPLD